MNKLSIIVLSILFISIQNIFAQEKNNIGMELRAISKGKFYMVVVFFFQQCFFLLFQVLPVLLLSSIVYLVFGLSL